MVYFIEAVGAGLVKIGFTDGDPMDRLKQLQTGCPHALRLRGVLEGDQSAERAMHQQFAHLREGGEWFKFTIELEVYVGLARWFHPRLLSIESRLNDLQRSFSDACANAAAVYDNLEGVYGDIEQLQAEVRILKSDGILATFGGE